MWPILIVVYILSVLHALAGVVSLFAGVATSISSDIWTAHTVSPIWSGAIFLSTAIIGLVCARKKSAYLIMCYLACSVLSLVVCVVSIQLLRLGLIDFTIDGQTYAKDQEQRLIMVALATAATEIAVSLLSAGVGCRLSRRAKRELGRRSEGTFTVHVMGSKDIIIRTTAIPPVATHEPEAKGESSAGCTGERARLVDDNGNFVSDVSQTQHASPNSPLTASEGTSGCDDQDKTGANTVPLGTSDSTAPLTEH